MDPYDQVQDAKAELAHDGIHLTTPQIVRHTLDYETAHDVYRLIPREARHPFGLPILTEGANGVRKATGDVLPLARAMTPQAPAAHPSPAAGADGSTSTEQPRRVSAEAA